MLAEKPCEFINRIGDKIELVCVKNDEERTEKVIDYKGIIYTPIFFRGSSYFYIIYNMDKWFLFK
jgi:hypothetical protein